MWCPGTSTAGHGQLIPDVQSDWKHMPPITTVIFDMYDTLVGINPDQWKTSFAGIIKEQGLSAGAHQLYGPWLATNDEFRKQRVDPGRAFKSYRDAWEEGFANAFAAVGEAGDPRAAADRFLADLSQREPFPETIEALGQVAKGHRTALLSNADDGFLLPNVDRLGLNFEQVLSSEQARVYKPLPGLFQQMLRTLQVKPEEALYVGDRQYEDVFGASRLGMRSVWINRSNQPPDLQLPKPTYQIANLTELLALLDGEFSTKDKD